MAVPKNTGKKTQAVKKQPVNTKAPPKTPPKGQPKQEKKGPSTAVIFWLIFFVVITVVFLVQREAIKENYDILTRRLGYPKKTAPGIVEEKPELIFPDTATPAPAPTTSSSATQQSSRSGAASSQQTQTAKPTASSSSASQTANQQSGTAATKPLAAPSTAQPVGQPAATSTATTASTPTTTTTPAAKPPSSTEQTAATREQSLYFTQVGKDGTIFRSKVSRRATVSDSPMLDSLRSLLAGPTAEEQRKGIMSLIPPNTRIISAQVRGTTAYISLSEDFMYNTYGVEGYAAQIREIVWTATEFSTVKDVQILIEGRPVEYLGEGIYIGVPIGRESL